MTIVLSLLAAMMALGGGNVDAVTPGAGGTPTPGGSSGVARVTVVAERPQLTLGNDESVGLTVDVSGFAAGAVVFLPKPFTTAQLQIMLQMLIGKSAES